MKVRVLGCSGGLGDHLMRTTSLLVDDDILLDAGTGVGDLALDALLRIDHVFVTHSHMDHIACLPLLVDAVWELRQRPITVHAAPETLDILRSHIFNWAVWPDFTVIPEAGRPALQFQEMVAGARVDLGARRVTALPANHTVPAVGYLVENCVQGGGWAGLAFTGDTAACEALWQALNQVTDLRYLIAEAAFPDMEAQLVRASRHLSPSLLAAELTALRQGPEVFVAHLKPSHAQATRHDLATLPDSRPLQLLRQGQVFEI